MRAFLMTHPEMGIYLGSCMGLGFWTKLDPVGQTEAVTFPSEERAKEIVETWQKEGGFERKFEDMKMVPVETAGSGYATMDECVTAGLEAWDPNEMAGVPVDGEGE